MKLVPDDAEIVSRARKGGPAVFNELVERYQSLVFNVCLRMLSDAGLAEDAAQETFFAAYRALSSFRDGTFRSWLLRIATNQCYDALRALKRHPASAISEDTPDPSDPEQGPEARALSREMLQILETAIRQLPPDQRLAVILVDVQSLDYAEAAAAMGVGLGTVKSRLSRARAQLRELLPRDLRQKIEG